MCGIVGYVGERSSVPILIEGLERLEYRGYDSAGIAVETGDGLSVVKTKGKVADPPGDGPAVRRSRHRHRPHPVGDPRRAERRQRPPAHRRLGPDRGRAQRDHRERDVDPGAPGGAGGEVRVGHRLRGARPPDRAPAGTDDLADAVRKALAVVEGTYGIAVIDRTQPGCIVVARNGSPVVLGLGNGENFVASDVAAIVRHTQQVGVPRRRRDGRRPGRRASGRSGSTRRETTRRAETISWGFDTYEKGEHSHFMRKEIYEQPEAVRRTLSGRLDRRASTAHLGGIALEPRDILRLRRVRILGCGSAYYAGRSGAEPDRAARPDPGRGGTGVRVPLPEPDHRTRHALRRGQPVRRDARHAAGGAGGQAQGWAGTRRRQRRREHDRPGVRRRHLPARRPGDLGRVDEGVHVHRRRAGAARPPPRPGPRSRDGRRRPDHRRHGRPPGADRRPPGRSRTTSPTSPNGSRPRRAPCSSAASTASRSPSRGPRS